MCPPGVAGETGFAGRGGVTRGRSPGSYPSGASGIAPVPVRSGQGAFVLVDDELDEAAAVEVDDGHTGQSRCALTRSATGPLARTRTAPCATGRSARRGCSEPRAGRAGRVAGPCRPVAAAPPECPGQSQRPPRRPALARSSRTAMRARCYRHVHTPDVQVARREVYVCIAPAIGRHRFVNLD